MSTGSMTGERLEGQRAKALKLTDEQRQALTEDEARGLAPFDTMMLATFRRAINKGYHPWEALCYSLSIDPNTPPTAAGART